MRHRPLPFLLALALLALSACSGTPTEPDNPRVTGVWSGSVDGGSIDLTLIEVLGGRVKGSGTLTTTLWTLAFSVREGIHAYPTVTLRLGASGYRDFIITGQLVTGTLISGKIYGSGLYDVDVNLTKN